MQVSSTSYTLSESWATAPAALLGRIRGEPKETWDEFLPEGLPRFRVEVSVGGSLGWDVSRGRIPDGQFLELEGCSEGSWLFKAAMEAAPNTGCSNTALTGIYSLHPTPLSPTTGLAEQS